MTVLAVAITGCGRFGFSERARADTQDVDGGIASGDGDGGAGGTGSDGGITSPGGDGGTGSATPVGTSSITVVGTGAYTEWFNTTNSKLGLSIPPGTKMNDLMVLQVQWKAGSTFTPPVLSTFKDVVPAFADSKCAGTHTEVMTGVAGDLMITQNPSATCTGYCMARITSYRGIDTAAPIDAIGTPGSTTEACNSSGAVHHEAIPGPVTTHAGDLLLLFYGDANDDNVGGTSTQALPAGYSELYSDLDVDNVNWSDFAGYLPVSLVGALGTQTVTTTDETIVGWTGLAVAISPAP